jgi:hypothetical protein
MPDRPSEVPDIDEVRLVILKPDAVHRAGAERPAEHTAEHILRSKDDAKDSRINRNMLVFLAPDKNGIEHALREIRRFKAWESIVRDAEQLSLDVPQLKQAEQELERSSTNVNVYLRDAYCWLFVPRQESGTGPVSWETERVPATQRPIGEAASKVAVDKDHLVTVWSPALLTMEMDRWNLWQDSTHATVRTLWEYFARYPYLPRLRDRHVLEDVVVRAVESGEDFGYADAVHEEGYKGVKVGQRPVVSWDQSAVLVKASALPQSLEIRTPSPPPGGQAPTSAEAAAVRSQPQGAAGADSHPTRFWAAAELDHVSGGKRLSEIMENVVAQLVQAKGTKVRLSLEITAENERGFPADVRLRVSENANHLKVQSNFEKE